jgi:hypothetical protein
MQAQRKLLLNIKMIKMSNIKIMAILTGKVPLGKVLRLCLFSLLIPFGSFSQQTVGIRIVQGEGTFLNEFETTLYLKKEPFKVQVLLENVRGVYVFANIQDSIYRFTETDSIQDFKYLPMLELNENPYNSDKELNISRTGWSNWYYDPTAQHPFQQKVYSLYGDGIVCTKYIAKLYDVAGEKQIRMRDIDTPLYLFFIAVAEYDKDGRPIKELMRRKVKIEWKDGGEDQ